MRKLLIPISLIYSFVLFLRHKLYDWGILKSKSHDIPNICVGNLNLGGTGKTPHIEYLIRLLSDSYNIAILSRGYGRKTKGFLKAKDGHSCNDIGDEPLQYLTKFNNIDIAVDGNRCEGMEMLLKESLAPQVVLLDDAYQHRKIKAGLNILLTDYYNIYSKDYLFPAGKLRDIKSAARRADIIVVTKSPDFLSPYYRKDIEESLKPLPHQKIFYSYIEYQEIEPFSKASFDIDYKSIKTVLILSGIANTYSLEEYIKKKFNTVQSMEFPDHHNFSKKDIDSVTDKFNDLIGKSKAIITTEKDAMRLRNSAFKDRLDEIPIFTIPIKVKFHKENGASFDDVILDYIKDNLKS